MKKEKLNNSGSKISIKQISTLAILATLGIVAATVIKFPLLPSVEFMTYDPDDIPVLLATLMFGPFSGVMVAFVVCVFEFIIHSTTGFWGILMHFIASASLAIAVGLVLKINKKRVLLSFIIGSIVVTIVMVFLNLIITPIYTGWSIDAVKKLIIPAIIPFNLLKGALNTIVTYLLYGSLKNKTDLFKRLK